MPSTRNWTLEGILNQGLNFQAAHRISVMSDTLSQTIQEFDCKGIPLVIEDLHKDPRWPQCLFTLDQFIAGTSPDINVRNIHNRTDSTLPVEEFIAKCRLSSAFRVPDETARFYGKDAECPKAWETWLQNGGVVPEVLLSRGKEDLFHCRPDNPEAAVETLMCYLGIGDTFTPCHKDLCASSGQNLMCYTERDGSSFWFMTESSSAPAVAEYFREELGQELDSENHVITIEELTNAPFKVFVLRQRLGDMVLVPPRSCHQVINSGGITVKTSWSRMTLKGLSTAYHYELPIYRRVCRPETYRIKSTIHHVLVSLTNKLASTLNGQVTETKPNQPDPDKSISDYTPLVDDLKELLSLYDRILVEEYEGDSAIRNQVIYKSDTFNDDVRLVCDFCSGDIFQSFFECRQCCDRDDDSCQLCPGCYVEGRNCKCGGMQPRQYQDFQRLIDARTKSLNVINAHEIRYNQTYQHPLDLGNFHTEYVALFQAACILYKRRRDVNLKRAAKVCLWKKQSHEANPLWVLNCKKCHHSKCFPHILERSTMHSAEALLYYSNDASHDAYHRQHINVKIGFDKEIDALRGGLKHGTPPRCSGYHLLVENATKYKYSRPRNTKYMQFGWYDHSLYTIVVKPISSLPSNRISCSQEITDSTFTPTSDDSTCDVETIPSIAEASTKIEQLCFVDIPKAPYDIARALQKIDILKEIMPRASSISSSVTSSQKGCQPQSSIRGTPIGPNSVVPNASKNAIAPQERKDNARTGLPTSAPNTGHVGYIHRLEKSSNRFDDHQPPSNVKIGPPISVARTAKYNRPPRHAVEEKVAVSTKATSIINDPIHEADNALYDVDGQTLPALNSNTSSLAPPTPPAIPYYQFPAQGIQPSFQQPTHPSNTFLPSTEFIPWGLGTYTSQDLSKKRNISDNPHLFHIDEEIVIKMRKFGCQSPARKTEHLNKSETRDHPESAGFKVMELVEFREIEASGADTQWSQSGNVPHHYPNRQMESPLPISEWASQGTAAPDVSHVSKMTLSSLQLQADSPTSIILGAWQVNTTMTKDGNIIEDLPLYKGIAQSPAGRVPQLPLVTNSENHSTRLEGEEVGSWGRTMLSPSSTFEVKDINFDNNSAPNIYGISF